MYAFMTTGTFDFLKKLMAGHPNIQHHFMSGNDTTLTYYEHHKKRSIFAAGKSYDILFQHENIREYGYIVMEHTPLLKESAMIFEKEFARQAKYIQEQPSILAARLLKESRTSHYVFLTQWSSSSAYEAWRKSEEEQQSFFAKKGRMSAYFANRPFTNKYYLITDEEDTIG